MRWPYIRPVLPRTSSGTSGFFFCGIILEPVQKLSPKSTKSNCAELHNTSSSEKRERCIMISEQAETNSIAKSRSLTPSNEFSHSPSKPSSRAVNSRSIGYVVPANAALPNGITLIRLRQSANRCRSRMSISPQANMW